MEVHTFHSLGSSLLYSNLSLILGNIILHFRDEISLLLSKTNSS